LENKKVIKSEPLNFFSNDMTVSKDQLAHNHLKLTYQRNSVTDLEQKHKEWGQEHTAS
tara:strand:+ start:582 stop:755 length:174 start_codon:yes stop_codon:yes gene_type:complete